MEQAKHTPGPWVQMGTSVGVTHGEIASVWEIDGRSFANARLIAAAPELLSSLEKIIAAWENGTPFNKNEIGIARAAITKATGATQ